MMPARLIAVAPGRTKLNAGNVAVRKARLWSGFINSVFATESS